LAVAKLSISRAGGSYVDYLVLEKIASDWRIVTKTWVTR
jgi:Putative lumazine-binding